MRTTIAHSFKSAPARGIVGKPKRVANNTFRWTRDDGAVITRLHLTDVVETLPDGRVKLNSGGWKSVTTKDRINAGLPAGYGLYSDKGVWTVFRRTDDSADRVPFVDGMILPDAFTKPHERAKADRAAKAERALKKAVAAFVCEALPDGKPAPQPSDGDCWYCAMFEREESATPAKFRGGAEDRPAKVTNNEHLMKHIEEKYMPGWLVVNAFRAQGYQDSGIGYWINSKDQKVTRSVVKRFLLKRLGANTR